MTTTPLEDKVVELASSKSFCDTAPNPTAEELDALIDWLPDRARVIQQDPENPHLEGHVYEFKCGICGEQLSTVYPSVAGASEEDRRVRLASMLGNVVDLVYSRHFEDKQLVEEYINV